MDSPPCHASSGPEAQVPTPCFHGGMDGTERKYRAEFGSEKRGCGHIGATQLFDFSVVSFSSVVSAKLPEQETPTQAKRGFKAC
jgi:hypothetical protein